jgi:hypothetical protein
VLNRLDERKRDKGPLLTVWDYTFIEARRAQAPWGLRGIHDEYPARRDHPDFTHELPRKLLPTTAKELQSRLREKP